MWSLFLLRYGNHVCECQPVALLVSRPDARATLLGVEFLFFRLQAWADRESRSAAEHCTHAQRAPSRFSPQKTGHAPLPLQSHTRARKRTTVDSAGCGFPASYIWRPSAKSTVLGLKDLQSVSQSCRQGLGARSLSSPGTQPDTPGPGTQLLEFRKPRGLHALALRVRPAPASQNSPARGPGSGYCGSSSAWRRCRDRAITPKPSGPRQLLDASRCLTWH